MRKIQFIVNPLAKNGYGLSVWEKANTQLKQKSVPFQVYFTKYPNHAICIAKMIVEEANGAETVVVAVGGDGTIHEVINGVIGCCNIKVGIIPCGSGNDFSRGFCIPTEPLLALENIIRHSEQQPLFIDIGKITDANNEEVYFVNNFGAGFDAEVANAANRSSLKALFNRLSLGALIYGMELVKTLFNFRQATVEMIVDNKKYTFPSTWFVTVANQQYYGGGMIIAPGANPSDGEFNIIVVNQLMKYKLLAVFVSVFWGGHTRFKEVTLLSGRNISINSSAPLLNHADGEIVGYTPINIEVLKKALKIIAPAFNHGM